MSVSSAVETQAGILRVYESRQGEFRLVESAGLLTDLRNLHDACAWFAQPKRIRILNTGGFVTQHYIPDLIIRNIRLGSL